MHNFCFINKHTKKNCAPSWLYLQDYTKTYGQQTIKFGNAQQSKQTHNIRISKHKCKRLMRQSGKIRENK